MIGGQERDWRCGRGWRFGEAYMDGKLTVEDGDIYDLLDLLGRNMAALEATPIGAVVVCPAALAALARAVQSDRAGRSATSPITTTSTDQLYDFFLDRDRQYSCAYFKTGEEPLEQAQLDKKQHIAAKLLLQPGQKVLDIGSGWGGMGLFLSQQFGVDVTGVTLSKEQHAVSSRRALEGGVADRVRFKLLDYRQEPGRYDRIVSVGMFEHVGVAHYVEFFTQGEGAAGRRRRHAAAFDRPHGAAGRAPTPGCASTSSPAATPLPCPR